MYPSKKILSSLAGPSPPLFDKGECANSKFLASTVVHSQYDCLEKCQSHDKCHYATWRPSNLPIDNKGLCFLFETCSKLRTSSCQDCETSRTIARCDMSGICNVSNISLYLFVESHLAQSYFPQTIEFSNSFFS